MVVSLTSLGEIVINDKQKQTVYQWKMKCNVKSVEMVSGLTLISARQFLLQPRQMCWITPPLLTSVHRMTNSVYKANTQSNKPINMTKILQPCTNIFLHISAKTNALNLLYREIFKVLKRYICLDRMKTAFL